MSDLPLTIIDNHYDGMGDAVIYCWMAHSARAAGQNVKVNIRRWPDIGYIFGLTGDMMTLSPSERYFADKGSGSPHWHYEQQVVEACLKDTTAEGGIQSRFDAWCQAHGLGKLTPVRPPYVEHSKPAEWAETEWTNRDAATGHSLRVLVGAGCAWPNRKWPMGYYVDLAQWLAHDEKCNVVGIGSADDCKGMPYAYWGSSILNTAALIRRADLVVTNDTGLAHVAGTIGVPTVAICGPTRPEVIFAHMPEVTGFRMDPATVPCVGCHFGGDRGYRAACATGCEALYRLSPGSVLEGLRPILEVLRHAADSRQRQPEGRGGPAEATAETGQGDGCPELPALVAADHGGD